MADNITLVIGGDNSGGRKALVEMQDELRRLEKSGEATERGINRSAASIDALNRAQKYGAGSAQELAASHKQAEAAAYALAGKVGLANQKMLEMSQAKDIARSLTSEIDKLGDTYLKVGLAAGLAVGYAVKQFASFDEAMAYTKARINDAAESMDKLRAKALELGNDPRFAQLSAADVGRGFGRLAQTGYSGKDIAGGLGEATALATVAGGVSPEEAAQLVADAMATFKASAKDAPAIVDQIVASMLKGGVSFGQMSEALKMAGGALAQFNKGSVESMATLALLSKHMLRGSDAGTALKTFLLSLGGASDEGAARMKELGINLFDAAGNAKSMADIAGILHDKLGGLTQQQQSAALKTMFGSDAFRVAAALMAEGKSGMEEYMQATQKQGAASELAATQNDSLKGQFAALVSNVETLATSVGAKLAPVLTLGLKALNWLASAADSVNKALGGIPGVLLAFGAPLLVGIGLFYKLQAAMATAAIVKQILADLSVKAAAASGTETVAEGAEAAAHDANAAAMTAEALAARELAAAKALAGGEKGAPLSSALGEAEKQAVKNRAAGSAMAAVEKPDLGAGAEAWSAYQASKAAAGAKAVAVVEKEVAATSKLGAAWASVLGGLKGGFSSLTGGLKSLWGGVAGGVQSVWTKIVALNPATLLVAGAVAVVALYWRWVDKECEKARQGVANYNSTLDELAAKGQMSKEDAERNKAAEAPGVWDNVAGVFGYKTKRQRAYDESMAKPIVGLKKNPEGNAAERAQKAAEEAAAKANEKPQKAVSKEISQGEADVKLSEAKLDLLKAQGASYDKTSAALAEQAAKEEALLALKQKQVDLETDPDVKAAKQTELEAEKTKQAAERINRERQAKQEELAKQQALKSSQEQLDQARVANLKEVGASYADIKAAVAQQRADEDAVFESRRKAADLEPDQVKRQTMLVDLEKERTAAATRRIAEDKQAAEEMLRAQRELLAAQKDLANAAHGWYQAMGIHGTAAETQAFNNSIAAQRAANNQAYQERHRQILQIRDAERRNAEEAVARQQWAARNQEINNAVAARWYQDRQRWQQDVISYAEKEVALNQRMADFYRTNPAIARKYGIDSPAERERQARADEDRAMSEKWAQASARGAAGDKHAIPNWWLEWHDLQLRRAEKEAQIMADQLRGAQELAKAQSGMAQDKLDAAKGEHAGLAEVLRLTDAKYDKLRRELELRRKATEEEYVDARNRDQHEGKLLDLEREKARLKREQRNDERTAAKDAGERAIEIARLKLKLGEGSLADLKDALNKQAEMLQSTGADLVDRLRSRLAAKEARGGGDDEFRKAIFGGDANSIKATLQRARGVGAARDNNLDAVRKPDVADLIPRVADVIRERDRRVVDAIIAGLRAA